MAWDDKQYLKFANERTRAAGELLARVHLEAPRFVVDLGCGPGNSTALLRARFAEARIIGVDNSEVMLRAAREALPELEWVNAEVREFRAEVPPDLIFANAVLQWLPDHRTLLPELFSSLAAGGVLAIQMPRNFDEPIHRLMHGLGEPWDTRLRGIRPFALVQTPAFYYDLLAPDAERVDIWQTTYEHVMSDVEGIVEWVKGTGIRPYLDALAPDEQSAYLADYTQAIDSAYARRVDGKRLLSFPRIFIVAVRKSLAVSSR